MASVVLVVGGVRVEDSEVLMLERLRFFLVKGFLFEVVEAADEANWFVRYWENNLFYLIILIRTEHYFKERNNFAQIR